MKTYHYTWRFICFLLVLAIVGCSDDDTGISFDDDDDEIVVLPSPVFSFGSDSSGGFEFDVVGNPIITGSQYTFNGGSDEDNGCGKPGGDYIQLQVLDPIWENGFTIAAWVEFQEKRNYERIIDFGNGWGEIGGMNITFSRLSNTQSLALTSWQNSDSLLNREKGRVIAQNVIVHYESIFYVGTISPSGEMKIYVNGELVAEKADGHPVANVQRNNNYIGHSNWCDVDPDFKGTMNDINIYNNALSAVQVSALYDAYSGTD